MHTQTRSDVTTPSSDPRDAEAWQKLINLKNLLSAGFITKTEYGDRKRQLIDEMTGTTVSSSRIGTHTRLQTQSTSSSGSVVAPVVLPRGPPDFANIPSEKATKYTYDIHTRVWKTSSVEVKLDPIPFSRGALRLVYYLQHVSGDVDEEKEFDHKHTSTGEGERHHPTNTSNSHNNTSNSMHLNNVAAIKTVHEGEEDAASEMSSYTRSNSMESISASSSCITEEGEDCDEGQVGPFFGNQRDAHSGATTSSDTPSLSHPTHPPKVYVAKISLDPRDNEDREIYFRDVEMQTTAKYYAELYNEYSPPKRVAFVNAWILRLEEREGKPLCGVERFIAGQYRKWNNNFGFVSEDERNTPQAFSHFTYESSQHRLLVCDIQGVSDLYTDPQAHSLDRDAFGKGNLGQRGIDRFLQTHRCNPVCRYLKLPSINANYSDLGTLPMTQYMSFEQVRVVNISNFPRHAVASELLTQAPLLTSAQKTLVSDAISNSINDGSSLSTPSSPSTSKGKSKLPDDYEDQNCKGFCNIL